jgi:hypothetical protein
MARHSRLNGYLNFTFFKRRKVMGKPKPLTQDQVSGEMQDLFNQFKEEYGQIPNQYGVMARCPKIMKAYLPLNHAVHQQDVLEKKYKELAWLKASNVNGCQH